MIREMADRANQRYADPQMRLNHMREQLQRIMLVALHDAGAFRNIAFVGGTCLRIVHGLRRYSENLDFSLIDPVGYDFSGMLQKIKTKLHALCCRKYTKGRDWYDLVWYLTRQPPVEPNVEMLTHAVAQTEANDAWDGKEWRDRLQRRIAQLDINVVTTDIKPFVERRGDLGVLSQDTFLKLVGNP